MAKYGLNGKFKAKLGKESELADILLKAAKMMSSARGCQLYIVSKDINVNEDIWVTEVWENKQDHDNSLNIDGVKELISQALPLIEDSPKNGLELAVLGGHGIN